MYHCMQLLRQKRGVAWLALTLNRRQIEQKLLWQRLFKLLATCMLLRHVLDFFHDTGMNDLQTTWQEAPPMRMTFHFTRASQGHATAPQIGHTDMNLLWTCLKVLMCVCWSSLKVNAQLHFQQRSVFYGSCHFQLQRRLTSKPIKVLLQLKVMASAALADNNSHVLKLQEPTMPAEQVNEEAEQPMYFQVHRRILLLKLGPWNSISACCSAGQHSHLASLCSCF